MHWVHNSSCSGQSRKHFEKPKRVRTEPHEFGTTCKIRKNVLVIRHQQESNQQPETHMLLGEGGTPSPSGSVSTLPAGAVGIDPSERLVWKTQLEELRFHLMSSAYRSATGSVRSTRTSAGSGFESETSRRQTPSQPKVVL